MGDAGAPPPLYRGMDDFLETCFPSTCVTTPNSDLAIVPVKVLTN